MEKKAPPHISFEKTVKAVFSRSDASLYEKGEEILLRTIFVVPRFLLRAHVNLPFRWNKMILERLARRAEKDTGKMYAKKVALALIGAAGAHRASFVNEYAALMATIAGTHKDPVMRRIAKDTRETWEEKRELRSRKPGVSRRPGPRRRKSPAGPRR